jgi:ribulose-phosphate 3-epimerase
MTTNMKSIIIPAILATTGNEARDKFTAVQKAKWIQLDCVDGKFAQNKTWYDARAAALMGINANLELHLMVRDPRTVIQAWRKLKNVKRVIWHVEAKLDHKKLIRECKKWKLEVGLALNPETPPTAVLPFLADLNCILLLGVHPGKSGQKLIPSVKKKINVIQTFAPRLPIEWDGGLTAGNLKSIAKLGVTRLCLGSAIFDSPNPQKRLSQLQKAASAV